MDTPRRTTFWLIDHHWVFYLLAGLAVSVFAAGVLKHVRAWAQGAAGKPVRVTWATVRTVLVDTLLGRRIFAGDVVAGTMHAAILWGFLGLFLGTVLNAFDDYVYHVLRGTVYLVYSVGLEAAGLSLLGGLSVALIRRYVQRLDRLERRWEAVTVPAWLLLVALSGFAVEGLRLGYQDPAWSSWSFAGLGLGNLVTAAFGLSRGDILRLYPLFWWVHAILSLALVAALPWTRLFHALAAPASIALNGTPEPVLALETTGEDEEADGTRPRFTFQQLVAFDACTHCGRCVAACPAVRAGEPLDPRAFVTANKSAVPVRRGMSPHRFDDKTWHCTTCRACADVCPVHVPVPEAFIRLRATLIDEGTRVPPRLSQALDRLYRYQNPWEASKRRRTRWAKGLEVPLVSRTGREVDFCYFVGCTTSLEPRAAKMARAFVQLLAVAGQPFVTLGRKEPCCGDIARVAGEQALSEEQMTASVALLETHGIDNLVTTSPHCYHTIRHGFPAVSRSRPENGASSSATGGQDREEAGSNGPTGGKETGTPPAANGPSRVRHYTEVLQELLEAGRIAIDTPQPRTVTFHDPCYLGRYNGLYDAPRRVIDAIPGIRRVEMAHHGPDSLCCGGGGARVWVGDLEAEVKLPELRVQEALASGADTLCTACPLCLLMLEDACKSAGATDRLVVMDVAELLARCLDLPE